MIRESRTGANGHPVVLHLEGSLTGSEVGEPRERARELLVSPEERLRYEVDLVEAVAERRPLPPGPPASRSATA